MDKYQTYKQSGVEWIGEIPSHWEFIKTNILTDNLDGKRVPLNSEERGEMEGEYPYWGSNGIVDYVNKFIFNEEIVLVGEDGSPFFDKLKDVSFYINEPVWVNNHIHILKPKERILPKYLTHSFNCVDYKEYITGSTRDKLTQSDLKRISHCVPPLSEQHQIVQFLDDKTELIDKLISTKERKITLLKEQRTSLINEVVTRGLNPNVKMKDSGIEWIGEIPEGWKMVRVSNFGTFFKGNGIKKDEVKDEGIPCIRYGEIYTKYERIVYYPISFIDLETSKNSVQIKKGDILFTGSGETLVDIGKSVLYYGEENIFVGGDIIVLRLKEGNNPLYLSYLLNSSFVQYQKSLLGRGEIIVHIYSKNIKEIKTPIPPLKEQLQIVEHLNSKTKEIDDLVQLEQQKIDLLKEYRQSLISEVVTGKIKVTN